MSQRDEPRSKAGESEQDYLARQADLARRAMTRTLASIKGDLAKAMSPREWAKSHPWATLGAAALAGLAATAAVVPSKEEQTLKKLARIERALDWNKEDKHRDMAKAGENVKKGGSGWSSIVGFLLKELIGALQPVLMAMLSGGAGGARADEETGDAVKPENGRHGAGEPDQSVRGN